MHVQKAKKRIVLLLYIIGACSFLLKGQVGFFIPSNRDRVDIPFEYVNNFIVLKIQYNGVLPLNFIFDTGAEHTIITKKEIATLFSQKFDRKFTVMGSDLKTELTAYLARNIALTIPGKTEAPHHDLLVLEEDYFNFDHYVGIPIHGILSGNVFARYLFKINYDRRLITLYKREALEKATNGFTEIPINMNRSKPYLDSKIHFTNQDTTISVRLLVDSGASLSFILFPETHPYLKVPDNAIEGHIGQGLGGFLSGFTGRVDRLDFAEDVHQKSIVTFFQLVDTTGKSQFLNDRNGLVGNSVLNRFHVIFDYQNSKMYLKPGKRYQEKYDFDKSGLKLLASGKSLNKYIVQYVLADSPAGEAGIQIGDKILRLGLISTRMYSLQGMNRRLQGRSGKKIRIKISRNGKKMIKKIVLRDLL